MTDKNNYRPASILPSLSKAFEKCQYYQIYSYTSGILSKYQCVFRRGYSTQYLIIEMVEKWRRNLDQGCICGALLMDLYETFHCPLYDLLLAKTEAYSFIYDSLKLINIYLTDWKHKTKISSLYSSCLDLLIGVPQRSILVSLLVNIYTSELFLFLHGNNVASYANVTIPHAPHAQHNILQVSKEADDKAVYIFSCFQLIILKLSQRNFIFS